jgi:hypothetical protein
LQAQGVLHLRVDELDGDAMLLRRLCDLIRMISVDSFRLENVLLSYASAVAALSVRLAIYGEVPWLRPRRDEILKNLKKDR